MEVCRVLAERKITKKMVETARQQGQRYWDPKNQTYNYVLKGGFASGKDLLVGQNPVTGVITTVLRGKDLDAARMVPF
jgi:hypothetical protein